MRCVFKHQRAYDRDQTTRPNSLYCPDCKKDLTESESKNVILRLLRNAAGIETSEEQYRLEKEIP